MRTLLGSIPASKVTPFELAVYDLLEGGGYHALGNLIHELDTIEFMGDSNGLRDEDRDEVLKIINRSIDHAQTSWDAINATYQAHLKSYLRS